MRTKSFEWHEENTTAIQGVANGLVPQRRSSYRTLEKAHERVPCQELQVFMNIQITASPLPTLSWVHHS